MDNGNQERLYHWDFSRAFYLLLGIPFHVAAIYSTTLDWVVTSPQTSHVLTWLADFLHTFRMPGFFLLAGFFSIMILSRKEPLSWLKARLFRLGVPLITATLLFLPLQILVQSAALSVKDIIPSADFWAYTIDQFSKFGEPWISYLWFLWCLIIYCVGLAMISALIGREKLRGGLAGLVSLVSRHRIASLAILFGLCAAAAYGQSVIVAASPFYGNAAINYNAYAIYFCLGVVLFCSPIMQASLFAMGPIALGAGIILVVISVLPHESLLNHTVSVITGITGAYLIVGFISSMALKHFNKPNEKIRKLVNASFTIYLFHHPIVMILATLFLMINLPPIIEFLIIVIITGVSSFAFHVLISKSPILMLLFNGIKPTKQVLAS